MLTLLINESNPLDGLFANSTTGGVGTVPDITVADDGQAVSVQSFTRAGGIITDSFVAGDALHIGIGDGVNAPVCYVALSSASPATGTMPINTAGMVALFAATVANQLSLTLAVVRTRGAYTNTIFSAPIVIRRSAINISTAVPTPSILGTGVAAALQVAINTALGFVRLDSSARLPAVDGSQLTNLPNTGVTSITGTANEITVTGTTTPTLSLPSALTFTAKTITGGTFASPTLTTPAIGDGTESAPSLSFTGDTNTGVYRPAADTVGIVGGGNDVVRMTGIASATDYLEIKNGIGVGSPLHVLAEGASANIGVHLQPKGSGLFTISDGTDFNKGIRFRSSSSAASAITLLDAVSTAGRVVTLPDATGTLALVSGDLGTPTAIVGTNITGTASGLTAGNATLAATVAVANEATDTSCFPLFATAATGSLAALSNAGLTFNSATGLLSATGLAATTGTFDSTVTVGANSTVGTLNVKNSSGTTTASINGADGSASFGYNSGLVGLYIDQFGNLTTNNAAEATLYNFNATNSVNIGIGQTGTLNVKNSGGTTTASISGTDGSASFASGACTINGNGYAGAGSGLTGTAASLTAGTVTTNANLTGDVTSVGNATTLAAGSASALNSGTLDAARMANAGVHTGDATGTFPAITLNAAQTGITSVGTLTGGATGAGFTVALSTSTITGNLPDARNTVSNSTTTTMSALTTIGAAGAGTVNIPFTTSASSAITGSLKIGNGTAATNVGIGGGNINAGGAIVAGGSITMGSRFFMNDSGRTSRLTVGSTAGWIIVDNQSGVGGAVLLGAGSGNPGIFKSGTTLQVRLADNSADAPISASNVTASGTVSVTGATTLSAALITTPEALAPALNAGAACGVTTVASGFALNGVNALTLANGTNGQIKTIVCTAVTAAGTATLTPTTCSGFTTVAFTAAGQTLTLQYFTTGGWVILSVRGATPA